MPTALVTGANRGIGFEVARQLVALDWDVLVAARDPESGPRAANTLGPRARFVPLDVADAASVGALTGELSGMELSALVNNAGASFDGFDEGVVDRTLNVNFRGVVRVTEALLPLLAPQASLVMVSSGMGELGRFSPELRRRFLEPKLDRKALELLLDEFRSRVVAGTLGGWPRSAYGVSKAALNAYTRILARELSVGSPAEGAEQSGGARRRVNAVCPGWVRTRMGGQGAARSVEQGAKGIVWAATLGAGGPNGGFFRDAHAIDW